MVLSGGPGWRGHCLVKGKIRLEKLRSRSAMEKVSGSYQRRIVTPTRYKNHLVYLVLISLYSLLALFMIFI